LQLMSGRCCSRNSQQCWIDPFELGSGVLSWDGASARTVASTRPVPHCTAAMASCGAVHGHFGLSLTRPV